MHFEGVGGERNIFLEVDMLCLEIFGSDVGPLGSLDDSAGDALRFIPAGPLGGGFDEANRSDLATPSSFTSPLQQRICIF